MHVNVHDCDYLHPGDAVDEYVRDIIFRFRQDGQSAAALTFEARIAGPHRTIVPLCEYLVTKALKTAPHVCPMHTPPIELFNAKLCKCAHKIY